VQPGAFLPARALLRGERVERALAVAGQQGVEVDEPGEQGRRAVGDGGHHHAAVAVPEQHRLVQVLVLQHIHHVLDVGLKVEVGTRQVAALAQAGQGQRVDLVPRPLQRQPHLLPPPAAVGRPRDDHERRHAGTSLRRATGQRRGAIVVGCV
jgi:hypothetical protein